MKALPIDSLLAALQNSFENFKFTASLFQILELNVVIKPLRFSTKLFHNYSRYAFYVAHRRGIP